MKILGGLQYVSALKHVFYGIVICLSACGSQKESISVTSGIGACVKGRLINQCTNQNICELVCGAVSGAGGALVGGSFGAAAGVGAAATGCNQVCKLVPQCSDVFICEEYEVAGS
jgi:hypothetical protein